MALKNTKYSLTQIAALLQDRRRLWFIGIGGVQMSALAVLARLRGFSVAGSDAAASRHTARLQEQGVEVFFSHDAAQVTEYDAVIYTLAISEDNPEYMAAQRLGMPLISRANFFGYLMQPYRRRIGVSGSHGKSTVTAMLGEIFDCAGRAPSVVCGAEVRRFGAPYFFGEGEELIFEACEYGNSFLSLSPTLAVVLNTDLDHVDFFKSRARMLASFSAFAAKAQQVLLPVGEVELQALVGATGVRVITFGVEEAADYSAQNVTRVGGKWSFDLVAPHGCCGRITLSVVGRHNVSNALAAGAAALLAGVPAAAVVAGLKAFRGAARRMEYRGLLCGARIFDDYAHHPTEIRAGLQAARELACSGRLFVVFQSHTYTRTAAFFEEICDALRLADRVLIAEIYAAREKDTLGMSGALLARGVGERATSHASFSEIAATLTAELSPSDITVVMGAGDIDGVFGEFSKKYFTL